MNEAVNSSTPVNPRVRMVYVRQRLIELREERERLMQEMQWLRSELGLPEKKDPQESKV